MSGPPLALLPGRMPLRSMEEVTFDVAANLRDLVYRAKKINCKGTNYDTIVTAYDVSQLLKAVFAGGWITGEEHQMCDKDNIQPNINDVAAQVGLFVKNIGATSTGEVIPLKTTAVAGRKDQAAARATSGTKKIRRHPATAHKITKTALERTTEAHSSAREAKKPVYVCCMEAMETGVATFAFYDEDHRLLPRQVQQYVKLDASTESLAKAKGLSMQLHDKFKMSRGREHNLRAAVYLARNRLTHWANGNDSASRPEGEDTDLFVPYTLMRNLKYSDNAVMDMCREVRVPLLWEDVEELF
ncbi:hypothetical protein INS49_009901 [Diaporthe citri]|uniref:uncharacterized protein n=1 Tax=Diaporthe citri TaxID=83186 RepID=UPI001C7EE8C1|nr:uncharacterized protein INS49_009901 [Diaporthe citri]KAG6361674.1 hypothetical protein INS49_009901 [Diaporthe citri]